MIEETNGSWQSSDYIGNLSLKDLKALPKGTKIASSAGAPQPEFMAELTGENASEVFNKAKTQGLQGRRFLGFKSKASLDAHLAERQAATSSSEQ